MQLLYAVQHGQKDIAAQCSKRNKHSMECTMQQEAIWCESILGKDASVACDAAQCSKKQYGASAFLEKKQATQRTQS